MTSIHKTACIDPTAKIGDGVEIGPFCVIGPDVSLGDNVKLHSHVVIECNTSLGSGCQVYPFAGLGGAPQHLGYKGEATRLEVGDNAIIRESVTMNRGMPNAGGLTRVGSNGYFMAYSHVGHDCVVGDNVIFAIPIHICGVDVLPIGGVVPPADELGPKALRCSKRDKPIADIRKA